MRQTFNFNISLSVLNHLGRNLYRNIITILGEAISNSWDADANHVDIAIDRENRSMLICDDGIGMSDDDFQNKFLKIGYSKRKSNGAKSPQGRLFIGRKGIGKLALLSCSSRVCILSKTMDTDFTGGTIDNAELDEAITDDESSQDYELGPIDERLEQKFSYGHGTLLYFENLNNQIVNTVEYIKRAIALYFRFSLYDENFCITVNGDTINGSNLKELGENTQFLWTINSFEDPYFKFLPNLDSRRKDLSSKMRIRGYIASVKRPSQLKIHGSQEKVTIDLFVNGRLREKNILSHIPTARIVEDYVYGQIHFDELDSGTAEDMFTSSREGVLASSDLFQCFLKEFERLFKIVIEEWDGLRRSQGDDGDPDNRVIGKKERKAQELFNLSLEDYRSKSGEPKNGKVEEWAKGLRAEAQFNVPSYTECFVAENLMRKFIEEENLQVASSRKKEARRWRDNERSNKKYANISYNIRKNSDDIYYLDMDNLAKIVDPCKDFQAEAGIARSARVYKPLRDAIGHTAIITSEAKCALTSEFNNIKARLQELLKRFVQSSQNSSDRG